MGCNPRRFHTVAPYYRVSRIGQSYKLCRDGRICIPVKIGPYLMAGLHSHLGHLGLDRTLMEWKRRYILNPGIPLIKLARMVKRVCAVCQACEPPNWQVQGPISPNPVPPHIFDSLCLDIFSMPEVTWNNSILDCMLLDICECG